MKKMSLVVVSILMLVIFCSGCSSKKPKNVRQDIWDGGQKYTNLFKDKFDKLSNANIKEMGGVKLIDVTDEMSISSKELDEIIAFSNKNLIDNKDNLSKEEEELLRGIFQYSGTYMALTLQANIRNRNVIKYGISKDSKDLDFVRETQDNIRETTDDKLPKEIEVFKKYYGVDLSSDIDKIKKLIDKTEVK